MHCGYIHVLSFTQVDRQIDRQIDRQKDKKREGRQIDIQIVGLKIDRSKGKKIKRQIWVELERQNGRKKEWQKDRKFDRQEGRQLERFIDRKVDRQKNRRQKKDRIQMNNYRFMAAVQCCMVALWLCGCAAILNFVRIPCLVDANYCASPMWPNRFVDVNIFQTRF